LQSKISQIWLSFGNAWSFHSALTLWGGPGSSWVILGFFGHLKSQVEIDISSSSKFPSVLHCSQVGPHLGTRVPMGTFFSFWVPKRSPFSFQGPHFPYFGLMNALTVRAANVYEMLTIWIRVMTKLVWMNIMPVCQWNWICEDLFHNFVPLYFKKFACFDQFSKIRFLGPHFCWQRSPLGPHLTQNRVPIGSPFWTKLGPRGKWEQWFWFLLRNAAFYLKFTKNISWSTRLKSSHQIITPVKTPLHSFAFSLHTV